MPELEVVDRAGRRPQCAECKRRKRGHCGTERAAKGCLGNAAAAGVVQSRAKNGREDRGSFHSQSTAALPSSSQAHVWPRSRPIDPRTGARSVGKRCRECARLHRAGCGSEAAHKGCLKLGQAAAAAAEDDQTNAVTTQQAASASRPRPKQQWAGDSDARPERRRQCAVCKRQKRGHCGTERSAKGCLERTAVSRTLPSAGSLSSDDDDDDAAAAEAVGDDEWPEHPAPAERHPMLHAGSEAAALAPSPQLIGPLELQERLEGTRKARRKLLADFTQAQLKLEQDFLMQKAVRLTELNEMLTALDTQDATTLQALAAAAPAPADKPSSCRPPAGQRMPPLALPRSPKDGQTCKVPSGRATAASPAAERHTTAAVATPPQKPQASARRGGRPARRSSSDSGSDQQQLQLQRSPDGPTRGFFDRTDKLRLMHDILQTTAASGGGSGRAAERPRPEIAHVRPDASPPDDSQSDFESPSSAPSSSPSISAATAAAIAAAAASSGFSDSSGGSDAGERSYSSLDGEASPAWRSRNAKSAAAPTRRSSRVAGKSPVMARHRQRALGRDALGSSRHRAAPDVAAADAEAAAADVQGAVDEEPTAGSPCGPGAEVGAGALRPETTDATHSPASAPVAVQSRAASGSRHPGSSASAKGASSSSSLHRQVMPAETAARTSPMNADAEGIPSTFFMFRSLRHAYQRLPGSRGFPAAIFTAHGLEPTAAQPAARTANFGSTQASAGAVDIVTDTPSLRWNSVRQLHVPRAWKGPCSSGARRIPKSWPEALAHPTLQRSAAASTTRYALRALAEGRQRGAGGLLEALYQEWGLPQSTSPETGAAPAAPSSAGRKRRAITRGSRRKASKVARSLPGQQQVPQLGQPPNGHTPLAQDVNTAAASPLGSASPGNSPSSRKQPAGIGPQRNGNGPAASGAASGVDGTSRAVGSPATGPAEPATGAAATAPARR